MGLGNMLSALFSYNTVQIIQVKSYTLAILHHVIRLLILGYVAIFVIWLKHGYQKAEAVSGSVSIKMKGAATLAGQVYDAIDIIHPAKEENALFITTNILMTDMQIRGTCISNSGKDRCKDNTSCPLGRVAASETGFNTGNCLDADSAAATSGYCEVDAWCPTEMDTDPQNILQEVINFTLFARVTAKFPSLDLTTTNMENERGPYEDLIPGLNIWTVADILAATNTSFEDVATLGAAFSVNFNWDCDLDGSVHACIPSVSMLRLDDPNNPLSTGYNFRYATYSRFLNASSGSPVESRDLKKVYGLRFVFLNAGQGRSFDWATIVKAVGSTVALLGIATVLADYIATTLLPKKQLYQSVKYRIVDEAEEESRLEGIAPYGTAGEKEKLEPAPLGGGKAPPYYGSV